MNMDAEALAASIGDRVRRQRRSLDWTLDELASAADISRRMVVNVEQAAVNPSVGTLLRLSAALGLSLSELVEAPATQSSKVTASGSGAVLWCGEHGGTGTLVATTEPPDVVELWDWRLAAGDRHTSAPHPAGTRELLQVQEGRITIEVDSESHELGARDALSFQGDLPHSYANQSEAHARFTLTVFEPRVPVNRAPESASRKIS